MSSLHIKSKIESRLKTVLNEKILQVPGWINKEYFTDRKLLQVYSPKISVLLANIVRNMNSKHVVYTFFKNKNGSNIIKALLDMCAKDQISVGVFDGDLTDSGRNNLIKLFNNPNNREGKLLTVLIITDAGSEGISLLETAHIHILESSSRANKIEQVIGRVVRMKSHENLPIEKRVVNVWRYWSIPSGQKIEIELICHKEDGKVETIKTNKEVSISIDEQLYNTGVKTLNSIKTFIKLITTQSVTKYLDASGNLKTIKPVEEVEESKGDVKERETIDNKNDNPIIITEVDETMDDIISNIERDNEVDETMDDIISNIERDNERVENFNDNPILIEEQIGDIMKNILDNVEETIDKEDIYLTMEDMLNEINRDESDV